MASVYLARMIGAVGFARTVAIGEVAPAPRAGPRVRGDVRRRGAARGAHPAPERGADDRRRAGGGHGPPRDGVRGRGEPVAAAQGDARQGRARAAAGGGHHRRQTRCIRPRTPRIARSTSTGARSASCIATSRRRTSSSARTAWPACSTSAWPKPKPGDCSNTRGRAAGKASSAYMAPEAGCAGRRVVDCRADVLAWRR